MIDGVCHCGAVSFTMWENPKWLVDCNCSICRRIGPLWGHAEIDKVTITAAPEATISYIHGDRTLAIHTCKTCGCTTHWESLNPDKHSRMAVNFRMCTAEEISNHQIRNLDGADTWEYLDGN